MALFGDGLALFETVGILIGLATLAALYLLGSRLAGPAAGLGASLLFLLLSFFAASTWGANFVLPYSYAATLGTAFAMWSFYFLYRYLFDQETRGTLLAWSALLLFAALLSKQEIGLALALAHALALILSNFM